MSTSHTLNHVFKANVERVMQERGISRSELSRRMSAHATFVSMQLNRPCGVTLATVERYSAALGVPATELITARDTAMAGRVAT